MARKVARSSSKKKAAYPPFLCKAQSDAPIKVLNETKKLMELLPCSRQTDSRPTFEEGRTETQLEVDTVDDFLLYGPKAGADLQPAIQVYRSDGSVFDVLANRVLSVPQLETSECCVTQREQIRLMTLFRTDAEKANFAAEFERYFSVFREHYGSAERVRVSEELLQRFAQRALADARGMLEQDAAEGAALVLDDCNLLRFLVASCGRAGAAAKPPEPGTQINARSKLDSVNCAESSGAASRGSWQSESGESRCEQICSDAHSSDQICSEADSNEADNSELLRDGLASDAPSDAPSDANFAAPPSAAAPQSAFSAQYSVPPQMARAAWRSRAAAAAAEPEAAEPEAAEPEAAEPEAAEPEAAEPEAAEPEAAEPEAAADAQRADDSACVRDALFSFFAFQPSWWGCFLNRAGYAELTNRFFYEWRNYVQLVDNQIANREGLRGAALAPFEKNCKLWQQLWKAVNLSSVVLQVVDARNPLLFYSDAFRQMVERQHKVHLLVLNKADFLTPYQADCWQAFFAQRGVDAVFYSALAQCERGETPRARAPRGCAPQLLSREQLLAAVSARLARAAAAQRERQRSTARAARALLPRLQRLGAAERRRLHADVCTAIALLAAGRADAPLCKPREADFFARLLAPAAPAADTACVCGFANAGKSTLINSLTQRQNFARAGRTPGLTKFCQLYAVPGAALRLVDSPGMIFPVVGDSRADLLCYNVIAVQRERGSLAEVVARVLQKCAAAVFAHYFGAAPPALAPERCERARAARFLEALAAQRGMRCAGRGGQLDVNRAAQLVLRDFLEGASFFFCDECPGCDPARWRAPAPAAAGGGCAEN